jgi:hypothetical protein
MQTEFQEDFLKIKMSILLIICLTPIIIEHSQTVFLLYQVIATLQPFVQAQLFVENLDKASIFLQKNDITNHLFFAFI